MRLLHMDVPISPAQGGRSNLEGSLEGRLPTVPSQPSEERTVILRNHYNHVSTMLVVKPEHRLSA